jgi:hypothetical protein
VQNATAIGNICITHESRPEAIRGTKQYAETVCRGLGERKVSRECAKDITLIQIHPDCQFCAQFIQGRTYGVDLSEHELLHLVVEGQDTGTGNTSEDVGSGTLEERLDTLLGNNLGSSVEHGLVVDGSTGSHHHSSSDGVERVRSKTGTGGDTPTEEERGSERSLKRTDEDNGLNGVVCLISGCSRQECALLTETEV